MKEWKRGEVDLVPGKTAPAMTVIERDYPAMKKWVEYMRGFLKDGLMPRDTYGDWCVPPEDPALIHSKDPARKTDPTLLATAYFYRDLWLMERYAQSLGKTNDAAAFHAQAEAMKAAFNGKFLDRKLAAKPHIHCLLVDALNVSVHLAFI